MSLSCSWEKPCSPSRTKTLLCWPGAHYLRRWCLFLFLLLVWIWSPGCNILFPRLFFLRGFVNVLCSRRLDALADFQNLYKTDTAIFPTRLVTWLVDSLHRDERQQADRRPELKRLIHKVVVFIISYQFFFKWHFECHITSELTLNYFANWQVTAESEKPLTKSDDHVKKFELPRRHLDLDEFVRCVQECRIVKDVATIHRLFDALTDGESVYMCDIFSVREPIRTVKFILLLPCCSV